MATVRLNPGNINDHRCECSSCADRYKALQEIANMPLSPPTVDALHMREIARQVVKYDGR